jgi:preprotein translocase subunit YajC
MDVLPLLLLAVPVVLLFLMSQRQSRQRRALIQTQESLAPGQEVLTQSGLYATVVEVEPEIVVLETGPGQHLRWDRRAILRVVTPTAEAEPAPVGEEEGPPSASSPVGD